MATAAAPMPTKVSHTSKFETQPLLFAEDTAERFELTMEQWKSRPWYNKVSERILAPLRFMM